MRLVILSAAAACLALGGCNPQAVQARVDAQHDQQCRSYGAQPGTDAYVNCRVTLKGQAEAQGAQQSAAMRQVGMQLMTGQPAVRCTSMPVGTMVTTNCY